jgi:hypothetical protein
MAEDQLEKAGAVKKLQAPAMPVGGNEPPERPQQLQ